MCIRDRLLCDGHLDSDGFGMESMICTLIWAVLTGELGSVGLGLVFFLAMASLSHSYRSYFVFFFVWIIWLFVCCRYQHNRFTGKARLRNNLLHDECDIELYSFMFIHNTAFHRGIPSLTQHSAVWCLVLGDCCLPCRGASLTTIALCNVSCWVKSSCAVYMSV